MSRSGHKLNLNLCRERQQRFARVLAARELQCAVLIRPEHVQYFTGFRPASVHQAVVIVHPDGKTVLSAPNQVPDHCAADDVFTFEAQWNCTLRQDQLTAALEAMDPAFRNLNVRECIGIEASANISSGNPGWQAAHQRWLDVDPDLWSLRRCKDPDELVMIQQAIECTEAMYQRAREIIVPGISELEVYNQLCAAAVEVAGEPLLAIGNDFQCNSPGGSPRPRAAQQGELYILDLGVSYRGYYSDNCRTFAVGQSPSEEQHRAWQSIVGVLEFVDSTVRPGVSAKKLYLEAKMQLDAAIPGGFFHHLGHGIGLYPHETPHLNDRWDDTFQLGDVFTAEPGLYSPELRSGIRLEQDYLVTETGVQRLTSFPLEL